MKIQTLFVAALIGGGAAYAEPPLKQAVWVFPAANSTTPNPIGTASGRAVLVSTSAASDVTDLYISVYQSTPNTAGRLMYPDADITELIRLAHSRRIKIWAAYGNSDWPALGCSATSLPLRRMAEVVAYNDAHEDAEFDGVALDIEPPEPQSAADFQNLLSLYHCIRQSLPQKGRDQLGLAAAIRFFWITAVPFPAGGPGKPVYEHIIDMRFNHIIVMGYRNTAGSSCSGSHPDGIICLDEPAIAYAGQQDQNDVILAGLETSNCSPGCGPADVTFYTDPQGQASVNQQAKLVAEHFKQSRGFGGFAIHRYQDSYLSGLLTNWPAVNLIFPVDQ